MVIAMAIVKVINNIHIIINVGIITTTKTTTIEAFASKKSKLFNID